MNFPPNAFSVCIKSFTCPDIPHTGVCEDLCSVRALKLLALGLGLAQQGDHEAEDHSGGDASGGGGDPSGESAHGPLFSHRLAHPLCQQVPEAGEGNCRPRAAPVRQLLVDPR